MLEFHFSLSTAYKRQLENKLRLVQQLGKIQQVKRLLAILSLANGARVDQVALTLKVSSESVRVWLKEFLLKGSRSLVAKKSPGRPPKLTRQQKTELAAIIEKGPMEAGFAGACWRSPMIQYLIEHRYGIYYSVHYISELLKSLGFSYQKARFVSDHLDKEKRRQWLTKSWPEILKLADKKQAYILFGDEASFPQWGSLTYTWARLGHQPQVKTSGKRKAYKVFGFIDYFSGRFFSKCIEGRFCSESYQEFLKQIISKTRKHIILIQDRAKYHTSGSTKAFFEINRSRLTVFDLPSYSPDYNPIEKLWKKIKQNQTHLHYFPTFESLKDRVEEALLKFENAPQEIHSLFGFYDQLPKKLAAA
jgi:transposase